MKNKFIKIASIVLSAVMFTQSAFAMSDYKNVYHIDYMDEIFRFDTGALLEGIEVQEEEKSPYEFYMEVLKSFGVNLYDEKGKKTPESNAEFSDLYGAVASLISSNSEYIDNYKKGKFSGNVTMYDALDVMVDMLGYSQVKEQMGIESIASDEELLDGISYSKEKYITIGELAIMLWNTLNAEGIALNITTGGVKYEEANTPLMERQLDVYEISGFLNAANGMNIYKNSAPNEDCVEIDRAKYLIGESNATEFLGKRVTAYVQGEPNYDKKILFITDELDSKNITLDTNDIYSIDDYIKYEEDSKIKRVDVSNLEYILYNGTAVNDMSLIKNYEDIDGEIILSKTDAYGEYNVAIINAYEYFVVYSVDKYERKIHLRDNATFNGKTYIEIPEEGVVFCTLDGEPSTFESFYSGCSIKVAQNDKKTYTKIDASTDMITGKITEKDPVNGTVKVNGTDYRVSKTYANNKNNIAISTNTFGIFYVTKDKYIAGYKEESEASYGYLRRIMVDEDTEQSFAVIFTQMGKWETYELKEKIYLDGVDNVYAKNAVESIRVNNATDKLIRYKINGLNKVTFIDTMTNDIAEVNDDNKLQLAYEGTVKQSWQGGRWFRTDMGYRILDSSPVFEIPKDVTKTENYRIKTGANLNNDEKDIYIKLYSADEIGICDVAIISEQADSLGEDVTYWFYCEKVGAVLNEETQQSDYIMTGARITNGSMIVTPDFQIKVSSAQKEKLENTYPGAINKGTLLKVTYDTDGYLSAAEVGFTNNKLEDFWASSNTSYYQYFCGTVTNVDPEIGYIVVGVGKKVDSKGNATYDRKKEFPLKGVLCVDKSNSSSRLISVGELLPGEMMYVYKSGGWGRICVIVR